MRPSAPGTPPLTRSREKGQAELPLAALSGSGGRYPDVKYEVGGRARPAAGFDDVGRPYVRTLCRPRAPGWCPRRQSVRWASGPRAGAAARPGEAWASHQPTCFVSLPTPQLPQLRNDQYRSSNAQYTPAYRVGPSRFRRSTGQSTMMDADPERTNPVALIPPRNVLRRGLFC